MRLSIVGTIFRKELIDTLRDRRTLIFMLLVPMVAIPVLIMLVSKLTVSQMLKLEEETVMVAVRGEQYLPDDLRQMIRDAEGVAAQSEFELQGKDAMEELRLGELDAVIVVESGFSDLLASEQPSLLEIYYDKAEEKSDLADRRLRAVFESYEKQIVAQRLAGRDLSADLLLPFEVTSVNVAPMQKLIGKGFGTVLPYLIIIMCFMGAMYPAIDLAAGEKERGTLETLLVSPATRGEFVLGKYLVVLLTGIVAAALSTASLVYSLRYLVVDTFEEMVEMLAFEFDLGSLALVILVVVPLAGIFAGILLTVSIFARSFKEAQSYITSLNMLIILPAFVSFLPGVKLDYTLCLIPVVNASLIMKEALSGSVQWQYVFIALATNTALAALALYVSRKWFERESIIFRM